MADCNQLVRIFRHLEHEDTGDSIPGFQHLCPQEGRPSIIDRRRGIDPISVQSPGIWRHGDLARSRVQEHERHQHELVVRSGPSQGGARAVELNVRDGHRTRRQGDRCTWIRDTVVQREPSSEASPRTRDVPPSCHSAGLMSANIPQ